MGMRESITGIGPIGIMLANIGTSVNYFCNRNIGRFTTLATDLSVGQHVVQCQLLEETADPNGGHEFRVISLMRYVRIALSIIRIMAHMHPIPSLSIPFSLEPVQSLIVLK